MSQPKRSPISVLDPLSTIARLVAGVTLGLAVLTIALAFLGRAESNLVFVLSAVSILGLAWLMGLATERLGAIGGPHVGGILNATFGNTAELIIAFFALRAGLLDVVKASLTGSIIGNLLLVMGGSLLLGGLKNGTQSFNQRVAGANAALLVLAAIGLLVPAVFAATSGDRSSGRLTEESVLISIVLIGGYILSLIYGFLHPAETLGGHGPAAAHAGPTWSGRTAIGVLVMAAVLIAVLSEILVGSIESFIASFGLSELFVGVILIPIIGNLAENLVAVQLAFRNRMEFAMAVSYGSSLQVALFVAPVLVLIGVVVGQPMNLVFAPLEVTAVAAAVGITALVAYDGESNWLEGALLTIVYLIVAFSFFETSRG